MPGMRMRRLLPADGADSGAGPCTAREAAAAVDGVLAEHLESRLQADQHARREFASPVGGAVGDVPARSRENV
ncbi:hypothetical protein ABZ070_07760 [Streptomyces sp. NPDC006283]|uniref:hypothetical protein n=1 Tax=Streptomyces sp. NPDC006283 TaxID=3156741 RepID=UPI0033A27637